MERSHFRAGLTAFVITLTLLFGMLGAVRVDCVTRNVLHGDTASQVQRIGEMSTEWLPPSVNVLARVLRAERDLIETIIQTDIKKARW